jgi:CO/xanthine dehydrogenase Mo-binding subunit
MMITRRHFIEATATAGGLLLAGRVLDADAQGAPGSMPAAPGAAPAAPPPQRGFGAYLEITPDGRVIITCPQSEMGQGVHDALPKMVAEELEADWASVEVRMPHADDAFINPITKRHRTANSESVVIYYGLLRKAGATAREMLVAAAAQRWGVPQVDCAARASRVVHVPSGRSAGFGELAQAAAALPVPADPALKPASQFSLIGRSTPRKDTPGKVDGSATFGIDVRLPGMLYAAIRRSPAVSSRLVSFSKESATALPGVVDAFAIADGVAVVARSTWQARRAAEAMTAEFDDSASAGVATASIRAKLQAALDDDAGAAAGRPMGGGAYDKAATDAAIAGAPRQHTWEYEVPFLAHAALEPLTATVVVREDSCEAWAPTQQPDRARDAMAEITGLPRERCRLNVTLIGGGFGRKWENDFLRQAVEIARGVRGTPVKLTWTREQDFQHDRYRPAHRVRTRVGIGADGAILGMHSRTTGINMWKYQGRPSRPGMPDFFAVGMLVNDRYAFPNKYVDYVETPDPIPVGTWRSVSSSMNGFFSESAIDDVCAVTGADPLALRLRLLESEPRAQAVLRLAAEKAGWGRRLPKGRGLGIALAMGFGSYCAQVVEASVSGRKLKVERITCAFDCGTVIDPRTAEAQVEGGIVWGLTAALDGQIRFENGAAVETNFHTGPLIRIDAMPRIEVHRVRSDREPGGAGEASVPPVAPALASAIHAATGERPRRLPLVEAGFEIG